MNFVLHMMNFVSNLMIYYDELMNFVSNLMNFVSNLMNFVGPGLGNCFRFLAARAELGGFFMPFSCCVCSVLCCFFPLRYAGLC